MRPELPWLSHHFGITWSDIESMPFGELDEYRVALRQITPDAQREGWWTGGLS